MTANQCTPASAVAIVCTLKLNKIINLASRKPQQTNKKKNPKKKIASHPSCLHMPEMKPLVNTLLNLLYIFDGISLQRTRNSDGKDRSHQRGSKSRGTGACRLRISEQLLCSPNFSEYIRKQFLLHLFFASIFCELIIIRY